MDKCVLDVQACLKKSFAVVYNNLTKEQQEQESELKSYLMEEMGEDYEDWVNILVSKGMIGVLNESLE